MTSDSERAQWALEESIEGVLSFVKAGAYGLRLAVKRVGDLAASGAGAPHPSAEMEKLTEALAHGDDRLSDLALLALGDHFRAFLGQALDLTPYPALPASVIQLEEVAGVPGALGEPSVWLILGLQLYRIILGGGALDSKALHAIGMDALELQGPGGKVRMYREGDRVALTEHQLEEVAAAYLNAAKAIKLRLLTS